MDDPRVSVPSLPEVKVGDWVRCRDPFSRAVVEGRIRGFLGNFVSVETGDGWIYVSVRSLSDVPRASREE